MEQFHDGHHVWLRSRANGLYLCADDDRSGVSLQQDRASAHAAWAVHILHFNGGDVLMLHSAANGRYLAAYRAEGSWNVERRDLNRLPSLTFSWYALGSRYGDDVLLRHFKSMFFLRALFRRDRISNSGGVGLCAMDRGTTTMQWVVEAIPPRESVPTLPDPLSPSSLSGVYRVWYVRANPDGIICPNNWRLFLFYGRSVRNLSALLAIELGIRRPSDAILCVRAGFFGRLTPLVTNLPHNNMLLNLDIVVITAGTSVFVHMLKYLKLVQCLQASQ
uniref:Uncharacterized protein n=2 Tax=Oryza TaxID=4527 RepID=A0A0D3GD54_9ORYZ